MISICVPVYNFNVVDLINTILHLGRKSEKPFEIICIDDGSNKETLKLNSEISSNKSVNYQILKRNIGRAKIRNLFLEISNYENLLFIDCDCSIQNGNFLEKYFEQLNNSVVYGGRKHHNKPPKNKNKKLRWLYGIKKEDQNFNYRVENPYHSFRSNNFLIKKEILSQIRFNENIKTYGHEDTLLSIELKKNKIDIYQINNPIYHDGIEDNSIFLEKTKSAIKNLVMLERSELDISSVKLIKTYNLINKLKLMWLIFSFSKTISKLLERQLLSSRPSLRIFDLYKLIYFLREKQNV
ncbi:glycosyltransferase [Flavobacteriales bacterium]|nr:glycosyltransferase [Flavobacteriales bacterium]